MDNHTKDEILKNLHEQEATLLYFFSNHCAPCSTLRPKVSDLIKNKFPKMNFVLIDAEAEPEFSAKYQVFASPTIILFFDGKETRRFSKFISMAELEQSIERYYKMIFEE